MSGMALAVTGAYDASKAAIDEALVLADDLSDERLLAEALSSKVVLHWAYLQPREAVAVGLRASEMLRARGNLWGFVAALPFVGQAYTIMGLFEEAARIEAEAGPLARRLGHLGAVLVLDRMKGVRNSLAAGDLRAFEDFLAVDHENAAALGREWISQWRVWVGLLDFWRGRWEEGLTHLREAATEEVPGAPTGLNLGILLACAGLAGSSGEVLAAIERQGEGWTVPGKPRTSGEWTAMSGAAEALALLGEKERATALYPVLLELLDGGAASRIFDCRLIEGVAGLSAAAGDRWEEAERHFETALQQARHFPLRIEQAEVRRLYAHAYAERDPSRARALLTEAIDIYRDVGMPRHVERASEMLHGLG